MTIAEAAKYIAEDFNKSIIESECDDFKDMCDFYDWTSADVKAEIDYMLSHHCDLAMLDDGRIVNPNGSG